MEKSELMSKYEKETGEDATIIRFEHIGLCEHKFVRVHGEKYVAWLEAKATGYDRLMSGGKKTPKEVANFLGVIVAQDQDKRWWAYSKNPVLAEDAGYWMSSEGSFGCLSIELDFTGDWKDSLTLPDGWEEA